MPQLQYQYQHPLLLCSYQESTNAEATPPTVAMAMRPTSAVAMQISREAPDMNPVAEPRSKLAANSHFPNVTHNLPSLSTLATGLLPQYANILFPEKS